MSQLSFEQVMKDYDNSNNTTNNISFFSLKNDGDEAIVRFMHSDVKDFDMHSTHPVKISDKYTGYASCLRSSLKDPIENCPLCKNKIALNNNIFIHLIQYMQDKEIGNIVAQPKIWVRGITYARTLASLLNEYGPLSDSIFKIRRSGAAGSRETTYDIMYCRPDIYTSDRYIKNETFFKDYTVLNNVVKNYSYSDLNYYLLNGRLPQKKVEEKTDNIPSNPAPNNISNNTVTSNQFTQRGFQAYSTDQNAPINNNFGEMFNNGIRRYE